jgi:PPE-repeat protein
MFIRDAARNAPKADTAENRRCRSAKAYPLLATGMFAAVVGVGVATTPVAHADSSGRGSHSGRDSASSADSAGSGPNKPAAAESGSVGGDESAGSVPTGVSTRSVIISGAATSAPAVTGFDVPAAPANPWSITTGTTNATVATPTPKADPAPTFNAGFGNVGSWNFGSGNQGDWNFGNGNLGSGNVGSGNLGGQNFGIGNNGSGNFGGGNTGNGNIGFGNTGTGNFGIGLTGDNQIGFGGLNSGTGNMGLFNSGTGNTGMFNSGTGNWGVGNSGTRNTGSFNAGDTNTGDANVGNLNTGSFNVGHSNSGNFNTGSTNSGDFNSGDLNTGWLNSGDANTGLLNSGYLNTGVYNSGNASNGFFETEDNQNWFPGIHVAYTIPGLTIDRMMPIDISREIAVGPLMLTVGPTTADVHVYGSTGPIELTVLDIAAGPGFFNTGTVASSGFFNTGAGGGSGLLNTGAGLVSGFFNLAFLAGAAMSGYSNSGSGSGFSNLGSGVSGWRNTSSLSLSEPADLSGIENVGALLSGTYTNGVTGGSTFNLGAGNVGSGNFGDGNQGYNNLGAGNFGGGNFGFGNGGDGNLGSGNAGNKNFGGGNAGSDNVGSGNLGSKNFGWGNNGSGNVGGGNTGNGNIGFGNTGTGNFGIGLTGNNQFGFGALNSGTGNKGLFNSGTGNTGIFNSGTNNSGFANAGTTNTGLFNTGDVNTGLGNAGDLNTGSHNGGSSNTGIANIGGTNTGVANIGGTNSGWSNTGNANTGWVNTGNLNTGAWNTANGSNGLFWRRDAGGQLNIDLGADLSQIPITLNADIPVNIPITAMLTDPISIPSTELPASPIDTTITTQVELAPGVNADVVLAVGGSLGPIIFPGADVTVPELVGTLGGPGVSIPVTLNGSIGPGRISFFRLGGPGLLNSTGVASSGLLNSGAGGGSGFLNAGAAGISGLMNEALQSPLSGFDNRGSGSGFSNVGSAVSGLSNTSSLDPAVPAFVSGLRNFGTNLSGLFNGEATNAPLVPPRADGGWQLGIDTNVDISEIPISLDGDIGVNIPLSASLTGPVTVGGFSTTIPGNLDGTVTLSIGNDGSLLGPVIIPLVSDLSIGAINVPDINLVSTDPLLSGLIGGPDVSIPITVRGAIGPNSGPGGGGNAFFSLRRTDDPGLSVDLNANVAQTPIKLNADVPVDIPFVADFGDLTLQGLTIPGFDFATSNWQVSHNLETTSAAGKVFVNFEVPNTNLPVSDITLDPVTFGLPTLSGRIGGPGAGIGLGLDGGLGPFTINVPIGVDLETPSISVDKAFISQIPLFANLGLGVDLPVSLDASPITISQITIPKVTIGTDPQGDVLQGLVFQGSIAGNPTPPIATSGLTGKNNACKIVGVCSAVGLSPVVNIGPINIGPIEAGFPDARALSLTIGGPGKGAAVDVAGVLGPIVVSLANNTVEQFSYSYLGNSAIDVPINGSTGQLDLQQVEVSAPLLALLYQRAGYCLATVCTNMTVPEMVDYLNGGDPAGSALGPFPPTAPVKPATLVDTILGQPIGPRTLFPSRLISQGIKNDTPFSGSGTLGPFNLGGAA